MKIEKFKDLSNEISKIKWVNIYIYIYSLRDWKILGKKTKKL